MIVWTLPADNSVLMPHSWTQFDHITSVMNAYGAPYEIRAVQPTEIEGGANALNMTQVP